MSALIINSSSSSSSNSPQSSREASPMKAVTKTSVAMTSTLAPVAASASTTTLSTTAPTPMMAVPKPTLNISTPLAVTTTTITNKTPRTTAVAGTKKAPQVAKARRTQPAPTATMPALSKPVSTPTITTPTTTALLNQVAEKLKVQNNKKKASANTAPKKAKKTTSRPSSDDGSSKAPLTKKRPAESITNEPKRPSPPTFEPLMWIDSENEFGSDGEDKTTVSTPPAKAKITEEQFQAVQDEFAKMKNINMELLEQRKNLTNRIESMKARHAQEVTQLKATLTEQNDRIKQLKQKMRNREPHHRSLPESTRNWSFIQHMDRLVLGRIDITQFDLWAAVEHMDCQSGLLHLCLVSRNTQHEIAVILALPSSAVHIAAPNRLKWTNLETVATDATVKINGHKRSKLAVLLSTTEDHQPERAALDVLEADTRPTTAMMLKICQRLFSELMPVTKIMK